MIDKELNIHELDISQLWDLFHIAWTEGYINDKIFEKIKYGKNVKFDIREYIRAINEKESIITFDYMNEKVYLNNKKSSAVKSENIDDEIDYRKGKMMNILLEYQNEQIFENR